MWITFALCYALCPEIALCRPAHHNYKKEPVFTNDHLMIAPLRASVDKMYFEAVFRSKMLSEQHAPLKKLQFFDNYTMA